MFIPLKVDDYDWQLMKIHSFNTADSWTAHTCPEDHHWHPDQESQAQKVTAAFSCIHGRKDVFEKGAEATKWSNLERVV